MLARRSVDATAMGAPSALLFLDIPPTYTPSAQPSPTYSARPGRDERTLPCRRASTRPLLEFSKSDAGGRVRLVLQCSQTEVVADEPAPVYARNAVVRGAVQLAGDTRGVSVVRVRIVGRVRQGVDGGPSPSAPQERATDVLALGATLFDETRGGGAPASPSLPFVFSIPAVFEDERGVMSPLPPSYDAHITAAGGGGALRVEVEYSISVFVTLRSKKIFTKNKLLSTPFVYRPRTRPSNAPPVVDGSVLGALKLSPELWAAHPRALGPSSSPSTSALARSELLLPKSGVFCLSSKVPVHVQLVDPAHAWARQPPEEPSVHIPSSPSSPPQPQALPRAMNSELNLVSHPAHKRSSSGSSRWWRTLVTPSPPLPTPPARRSRRPATAPSAPQQPPRPALARRASLSVPRELDVVESAASMPSASALAGPRVFLVRRVSLSLGSVRACGAYACGEATLRRLSGAGIAGAWEGAIELDAARLHRVPGFRAAGLSVEDFVVVAWGEGIGEHAVPVRLVTDPFPAL